MPLTSALEKPNVDWEFKAGDLEEQKGTQRVDWFQKDGYWPQVIMYLVVSNKVQLQVRSFRPQYCQRHTTSVTIDQHFFLTDNDCTH